MGWNSNAPEVQRALARFPALATEHVRDAFKDAGNSFVNAMMTKRFTPYRKGAKTGELLMSRSGQLKRVSYERLGRGSLNNLGLRVYTRNLPYARLQEFGGTVSPKRVRHLTIPLDDALNPSGVLRRPIGIRAYPEGFFIRTRKTGKLFFVKRRGKKGKLQWLFYLHKGSVSIPPRLGFFNTWESQAKERTERIRKALREAMRRAFSEDVY